MPFHLLLEVAENSTESFSWMKSVHYVEKIPIHQFPVDHNYIMHLFTLKNFA